MTWFGWGFLALLLSVAAACFFGALKFTDEQLAQTGAASGWTFVRGRGTRFQRRFLVLNGFLLLAVAALILVAAYE